MEQKRMSKKAGVIALTVFVVGAVLLGLLLLNKGDGPVTGMILSSQPIADSAAYKGTAEAPDETVYLVVSNAFNQFQVDHQSTIAGGVPLVATISFVECPAGTVFTGSWLKDGEPLAASTAQTETEPYGVLSFSLEGAMVTTGEYTFMLSDESGELFRQAFRVE